MRTVAAFIIALLIGGSFGAYLRTQEAQKNETGHAGLDMALAAQKFTKSLDDQQRAKAVMPYESAERFDWHFIPKPERKGLQIKEMKPEQRKAAHALLAACLSEVGYQKAQQIMELESVLQELEKNRQDGPIRDPERYYFTVFGDPAGNDKWGLSIEGHHLSLNFVIQQDTVLSCTPAVFATNPAKMMDDVGSVQKGTRILGDEEILAFELLNSLNEKQKKMATIAAQAPAEVRSPGEAQPPQTPAEGLPISEMTPDQRELLSRLVQSYTNNMPDDVARHRFEEFDRADVSMVSFAWAGPAKPGVGHYYRIQGPTFLIEFVNTQPDAAGNPANHIHSMWRDTRGDFGVPLQ